MKVAFFALISLAALVVVVCSIIACFTGVGALPGLLGAFFGTRVLTAAVGGMMGSAIEGDQHYVR